MRNRALYFLFFIANTGMGLWVKCSFATSGWVVASSQQTNEAANISVRQPLLFLSIYSALSGVTVAAGTASAFGKLTIYTKCCKSRNKLRFFGFLG